MIFAAGELGASKSRSRKGKNGDLGQEHNQDVKIISF